jgi:hypothetical protein
VDLNDLGLTDDERWHFLPAAQGGGEPAWCFEGRRSEQAKIATWLARHPHGLLMVTGDASAGKTALLGRVFTGGHPQLRTTLGRNRRLSPATWRHVPRVDAMVDMTGQDPADIVRQLAERTGLGAIPDLPDDPDVSGPDRLRTKVGWLQAAWQEQRRGWTIVVDSLDAAAEPMAIARLVLRPLAAGRGSGSWLAPASGSGSMPVSTGWTWSMRSLRTTSSSWSGRTRPSGDTCGAG